VEFHGVMYLLSGGESHSVDVLDTAVDNNKYTLFGLSAETNYTLSVAAVSVAGQSESTVITNVTTAISTAWHTVSIVMFAVVASVFIILALIGVCTCVRCV